MHATLRGIQPVGKLLPNTRELTGVVDRIQDRQKFERSDEECAGLRRCLRVIEHDEQAAVRFIDFHDLARPDDVIFVGHVLRATVDRSAVIAERPGTKRFGPLPGPVEFDRLADVDDKDRPTGAFGKRADLLAAQPLPAGTVTELLAHGGRGIRELPPISWRQVPFGGKTGNLELDDFRRFRVILCVNLIFHDSRCSRSRNCSRDEDRPSGGACTPADPSKPFTVRREEAFRKQVRLSRSRASAAG